MLITAAHRCVEALSKRGAGGNRVGQHHTSTVQDDRELSLGEQLRSRRDSFTTTARTLEFDNLRKVDIDNLRPKVARHVDLRRRGSAFGLRDNPIQNFRHARRVTDFFLVAHHVLEKSHLRDFLESALSNGLIGSLWRHQQKWRVVPVGRFNGGHEVRDAWAVLCDGHGHFAGGARETVGAHTCVAFVGTIPKSDPGGRK